MADVDSQNLGELGAITKKLVAAAIPDNLKKKNYMYNTIMDKKHKISGGSKITLPFKGSANPASMKSINGTTDVVDRNIAQQLYDAEFAWTHKYTSVNFTLDEMARTQDSADGWEKFMNSKKNGAINDGVRQFTQNIYASRTDATADYYDPKGFNGFADIFATSGTTYGGWADTDFSENAWAPIIKTTNASITYNVLSPLLTEARARSEAGEAQSNMYGDESKLDLIVTNQFLFSQFKVAEQAQQRYSNVQVKDPKDVAIGWNMYEVDGIKWMIDEFISGSQTAGTYDNWLIALSTSDMILQYKYGLGSDSPLDTSSLRIPNQTITGNDTFFSGAMTTAGRRNFAVHKNLG